jgi:hypothetical protein
MRVLVLGRSNVEPFNKAFHILEVFSAVTYMFLEL